MTTDKRTNEPTPEQIEAAANALRGDAMLCHMDGSAVPFEALARAALVAAAGATPQAESEELAWYKAAAKHSADSMAEARETLQMFADRVDPFVFDELSSVLDDQPLDYETGDVIGKAAPVQPSSTVDEDALAEVIDKALIRHSEMAGMSNQERWDARDDIACAVADWLKEQGR